jgi:photosystem I subunit IX
MYCIRSHNLNGALVYHMYVILLALICCVFTGYSMRDIKTYLSVAPVLNTLWFEALAGLLIEINRLFPEALSFPSLTSGCLYTTHVHGEN